MEYTLGFIAERIDGDIMGDKNRVIHRVCPLEHIERDSIVFVRDKKNFSRIKNTKGACFITDFELDGDRKADYILIKHEKKDEAFIELLSLFDDSDDFIRGISGTASLSPDVDVGDDVSIGDYAVIGSSTTIGNNTRIGATTVIGKNCRVGERCVFYPRVTIYPNTYIEDEVIIHSGTVIGSDGYGYIMINNSHQKIPQTGGVRIERNVEIGANTTVDRATVGYTRIGEGTKIDNLVQIGHNVDIGRNVIICALCGISGSVKIGNNVIIAGAVGLRDHIVIEDNVYIGAKSGVMEKRVKKGSKILGAPAVNFRTEMDFIALKPKIKSMFFDIKKIKEKLDM